MLSPFLRHLSNLPGWRTNRKIVVIESDDWGSIRMPSKEAFETLRAAGVPLVSGDAARYNLYDTLAKEDDLHALFNTLESVKDQHGKSAVFTAIALVANPDFERIASTDFQEYHYEPFNHTLERYYGHQNSYKLWLEGIKRHLFVPQFHAREHLNVGEWMRGLRKQDAHTILAFQAGIWGFSNASPSTPVSYQAAFDLYEPDDLPEQAAIIADGLRIFKELFGYSARFFVPPNGPFNNSLEATAAEHGIRYMGCSKIQLEPQGYGKTQKRFHYLGQRNRHKQVYLTRNCFFEPSQPGKDWVDNCLKEIRSAFLWKKPAVISSHRVNYIGVHDEENRAQGLYQLSQLLHGIVKTWPEAEFITSDELGDIIHVNQYAQ